MKQANLSTPTAAVLKMLSQDLRMPEPPLKKSARKRKIREEAEHFRDKMKAKNERIDAAKDKILRRANEEAHEIIQKAKDTADESIRKYNKWMKGSGMTKEMEKERANLRKALNETESELTIEGTKRHQRKHRTNCRLVTLLWFIQWVLKEP